MPPKSRPAEPAPPTGWLWKGTLLLVVAAAFLGGVIWAGRWAHDQLHGSPRYVVPFADIQCEPPAGLDRPKFLDEVRYYASPHLPENLDLLDDDLRERLSDGFGKHPWVDKVDAVEITPPKQIVVKLTYRKPVLAVRFDGKLLAVDAVGVLLPEKASTADLPIYDGTPPPPKGIGQRWGDASVEAAARKGRK
jgi:hypothetical protein